MSNDGSLHKDEVFNLETEQGVTHLLLSIRASEISGPQKNELRDLVFLYINGGHDESVRITLEQKISASKVKPVTLANHNTTAPQPVAHPFGTSRPLPTFTPTTLQIPKPTTQSVPAPEPVEPSPKPIAPTPSATAVQPAEATPQEQIPTPVTAPVQIQPEPAPVAPSQSVSIPVAPIESVTPPAPSVPVPAPVVEQAATPSNFDPEQNLNRIREIKSIVNGQVGNPVNLIDINNAVGREYMAALLDAMKKLSSGSSTTSAMSRLETAFVTVQETLDKHNDSKNQPAGDAPLVQPSLEAEPSIPAEAVIPPTPSHIPTGLPVDTITKDIPQPVKIQITKPEVTQPASQPEPVQVEPNFNARSVVQPDTTPTPEHNSAQTPQLEQVRSEIKFKSVAQQETQTTEPSPALVPNPVSSHSDDSVSPISAPEHTQEPVADFESAWGPATDTIKPLASATQQRVASLANVKEKLHTPADLADPASIDTSSVAGDSLYTDEVDNGLEQLLSEWPIFRKSGLFGTGPKGRAHPLFMKVANLQIPLLLAGRFEGATQETKQSITDYMNGWRYEQGIIYEQGENFEHYLRRVIRHILDLQNRKPLA